MFENIAKFFKRAGKKEGAGATSKNKAKERLHLVLMQDRANVSADFLDLMRQEIIEVIKKYIDVDESAMDVRLTNQANPDGTQGAPALYANIPILSIKDETRKMKKESSEDVSLIRNNNEKVEDNKIEENKAVENKENTENVENKEIEKENIEEAKKEDPENKEDIKKEQDAKNVENEEKIEEAKKEQELEIETEEKIEEAKKIVEEENNEENSINS